jgi:hypothetical protein
LEAKRLRKNLQSKAKASHFKSFQVILLRNGS